LVTAHCQRTKGAELKQNISVRGNLKCFITHLRDENDAMQQKNQANLFIIETGNTAKVLEIDSS